jgi:long-chain acyl-CoA synthetase
VCLRGVGSLRAYWRDARKTELVQAGGWHHSGDIGRVDTDGYLYLVDRANDMIKSGGLNVYPREVEQVIETISGVQQVCVIGVPSERWGEEVKALVIRQDGSTLSETDVITGCRGRLGGYKIPKSVDFLDAFPLNANGKVLKHRLRDRYRVEVGVTADAAATDREA